MRIYEVCRECGETHCTIVEGFNPETDSKSYTTTVDHCVHCMYEDEQSRRAHDWLSQGGEA